MKRFYKDNHSIIFQNDFCNWSTGELLSPIETQNYFIVQVTESYYNNSFIITPHKQYCDLEITFPTTNGLFCGTGKDLIQLNKYESYLSFRDEQHQIYSKNGCRFQTLAVNFKTSYYCDLFDKLRKKSIEEKKFHILNLENLFSSVIAEFLNADEFSAYNLDSTITKIIVKLLRSEKQPLPVNDLSPSSILPELINYIDQNFLNICSIEELTRFGYTYNHICKIFKKNYNLSPNEYLLSKKMEHAAFLLQQNKTLTEIAELLGYSSPYNFSRAFKQYYKIPPILYKEQQNKG